VNSVICGCAAVIVLSVGTMMIIISDQIKHTGEKILEAIERVKEPSR